MVIRGNNRFNLLQSFKFGLWLNADPLYEKNYSKHFKKTYAGKPTKRFLRLLNLINRREKLTPVELKQLFQGKHQVSKYDVIFGMNTNICNIVGQNEKILT